jgi:hypothetical protein
MAPHEHLGLREISSLSDAAKQACGFNTLLLVQPAEGTLVIRNSLGSWQYREATSPAQTSYALTLECFLNDDGIHIVAAFDDQVISPWKVERLLRHMETILQQLSQPGP